MTTIRLEARRTGRSHGREVAGAMFESTGSWHGDLMLVLRRTAQLGGLLLLCTLVFVTLCPLRERPVLTTDPQIERAAAFGALGLALGIGHPSRWRWVLAGVLGVAFGLEAAQELTPDRHGRWADALAKAVGGAAGVAASRLFERLRPGNGRSA